MRKLVTLLFILFFATVGMGQTITGPTSFCQGGGTILFVAGTPPNAINQWQVSTDGGITWTNVGTPSLNLTITTAGMYRVLVNGTATAPVVVTVNPNPIVSFSFNPNNQCTTVPVTFNNNSSGNSLNYLWDFGDPNSGNNNTNTSANPIHSFVGNTGNSTQNFTVKLSATSGANCSATSTSNVIIKQRPGTELNGSGQTVYNSSTFFTQCSGASSGTISLTNNSSTRNTNTNYRIIWGDNTPDFIAATFTSVQSHTYSTGTNNLMFIVTGGNGCLDTATYYVFIGSNPGVGLANPGNTSICSGNTLMFPITGVINNPIGTTYTVTFNDGSTPNTYSQPPPSNEVHTFNKSSCGVTSYNYNNSFSVVIQASNPCLTTSAFVVPIYVSDKPKAGFSILPKDTVCINMNVTLNNSSSSSYISGNTCTQGKSVWIITPSTGFSVNGNLGNDNGSNDPSLWTSGSSSLILNFNTPGVYSIKLKTGNPTCGLDSITKTICVNPTPTASFTTDQTSGCLPLIVNTAATTNVGNCGTNTFNWTVSYLSTSGCLPNTSSYSFLNGTSTSSQNPQFQFNNPGVYTINLSTIASGGTCSTQAISKQITVKGKPNVIWNVPISVCQSIAINPTASATCNQGSIFSYSWTFNSGTPQSSNLQNPTNIVFNSSGNFNISLDVMNECGITNFNQPITVSTSPEITPLPSSYTLCAGGFSGPYPLVISTGVTYTWTNTNTAIGLGASGTITQFQPIPSFIATNNTTSPISGTVTVTSKSNSGCTSQKSYTITVNPKPALANQITSMCSGGTLTVLLNGTIPTGTTYSWLTPIVTGGITGGAAGSNQTSITITLFNPTNTLQTATYIVIPTSGAAGNCVGNTFTVVVNVFPILNISAAITNPLSCSSANGSITLSGLSPNTSYTVQYTKNGGGITTGTFISDATGKITISGLLAGAYANISVTLSGCQSNIIAGPLNLVDPNPPATPTASSNGPLCSGNSLNLFSSSTSTGVTYSWTGPNNFASIQQNPIIQFATTAATGIYTVIVKLNGCASAPSTVSVTVNQTPSPPIISSPIDYCQNAVAVPLSATGDPGNNLIWSYDIMGSVPIIPTPTPNTTVVGSQFYYVSQINPATSCQSSTALMVVHINPIPTISVTSTNPTSCSSSNGTIVISGVTSGNSYKVQFTKDGILQPVQTITTISSNIIISNLTAGVYTNISITSSTGCTSNVLAGPFTITNAAGPSTPVAQSNSPVCSGSTLNLTASSTSGGTYLWSGPNGFTSSLQNPTILNVTTTASGTYSVTVTLNGCTSAAGSVVVLINQTPATATAASNTPLCAGSTLNLTSNTITTGVTYSWTGPNSFTSLLQNPTIANVTTAASGTYNVVATSIQNNCVSASKSIVVIINPIPNISNNSFTNPANCATSTGTITLTGLTPNTSYTVQYTKNGGTPISLTLISNANGNIIITGLSAGSYTDPSVTLNGCQSNIITGPIKLDDPNPPVTPTVSGNSPLCSGGTLNLTSTAAPAGGTYSWTGPNGFISSQQNPVINTASTAMSGTYSVTITLNGCTSLPAAVNVIINQTPAASAIASNSPVCAGSTLNLTSVNANSGIGYSWTGPSNFTSTLQNPSINNVTQAASGVYTLIVTDLQNNCSSAAANTTVTVNPVPNIISSSYTDPVNCISTTGIIILNGLFPNTNYVVQFSKNGGTLTTINLTSNNNGTITIQALTAGIYTNIAVLLNGCKSNEVGPVTLTEAFALPATPIAASNSPLCVGSTLNLSATSTTPNITYLWTGPNGFTSSLQNPSISNVTTANNGKYFVVAKQNSCISTSDSINVFAGEYPIVNLGPDLTLASGTQYIFNVSVLNGPVSNYLWTPSTNLSCSNCPAPVAYIKSDISYTLKATNIFGCSSSDTINIKVVCDKSQVFIPDAFSPDGDGVNDILMVRASGSVTIKYFRIFNKWGEIVFEKINFPPNNPVYGWDGKIKGKVNPPDVFVYIAEVMCDNGADFIYKGNVSILK